jgi:molecular chaperone GrpE
MDPSDKRPGGGAPEDSDRDTERQVAQGEDPSSGAAIAALERELAAIREERLRERADTENQRRRMQRDVDQARRFANERLLGDLLPVLDSLERGLEAGGSDVARLREGVELTLKLLLKVADDNGLAVVDPIGQPFDPERHQAMSTVVTTERPAGEVVQVFQKGYVLNDRLLRPALVVVSRAPDGG